MMNFFCLENIGNPLKNRKVSCLVNASDSEWRFSHIISGNCGSNLLLVKINEHLMLEF